MENVGTVNINCFFLINALSIPNRKNYIYRYIYKMETGLNYETFFSYRHFYLLNKTSGILFHELPNN